MAVPAAGFEDADLREPVGDQVVVADGAGPRERARHTRYPLDLDVDRLTGSDRRRERHRHHRPVIRIAVVGGDEGCLRRQVDGEAVAGGQESDAGDVNPAPVRLRPVVQREVEAEDPLAHPGRAGVPPGVVVEMEPELGRRERRDVAPRKHLAAGQGPGGVVERDVDRVAGVPRGLRCRRGPAGRVRPRRPRRVVRLGLDGGQRRGRRGRLKRGEWACRRSGVAGRQQRAEQRGGEHRPRRACCQSHGRIVALRPASGSPFRVLSTRGTDVVSRPFDRLAFGQIAVTNHLGEAEVVRDDACLAGFGRDAASSDEETMDFRREVQKYVITFHRELPGGGTHSFGTGTLVQWRGRGAVLSARHVLGRIVQLEHRVTYVCDRTLIECQVTREATGRCSVGLPQWRFAGGVPIVTTEATEFVPESDTYIITRAGNSRRADRPDIGIMLLDERMTEQLGPVDLFYDLEAGYKEWKDIRSGSNTLHVPSENPEGLYAIMGTLGDLQQEHRRDPDGVRVDRPYVHSPVGTVSRSCKAWSSNYEYEYRNFIATDSVRQ